MLIVCRLLADLYDDFTSQGGKPLTLEKKSIWLDLIGTLRFNRCSPIEPCINDNTNA